MVISDTDILISAIRNNEIAKQLIRKHSNNFAITIVTEMELFAGARSADKKAIINKVLAKHEVLQLSQKIGETALRLMKENNTPSRSLFLADALIAATSLEQQAALLTFNSKDFKFIKGLKFAK